MARHEEIIQQIRKALGRPLHGSSVRGESALPPASPLVGILPPIPPEELLPKFEAELAKVAGMAHRATHRQELEGILSTILSQAKAQNVVLSRNPLLAELNLEPLLRAWGIVISVWPTFGAKDAPVAEDVSLRVFAKASFAAAVGITGVDFALAETGSLVVTSGTEGAQLASLAPPVHVALYRRSQLVASLDEVLERLSVTRAPEQAAPGRSVVFITGTSRTADIEQILIRGVHGPGEVHAILVEEACS
ncbi:MAG TPA: lactate utilization protein [Terriglobia bacterium]|nr:lactate utilization protein [Terriglobia bacterium]